MPVLFAASKEDTFVKMDHTDSLFVNYKGRNKKILFIDGNHNA